jgi:hypothetical protein
VWIQSALGNFFFFHFQRYVKLVYLMRTLIYLILISQFLVRKRWSDLSDEQKQSVFSAVPKLIAFAGMASAWSIKNTMAIIVSQLIGQDVAGNWAKLVDALSCDEIMV